MKNIYLYMSVIHFYYNVNKIKFNWIEAIHSTNILIIIIIIIKNIIAICRKKELLSNNTKTLALKRKCCMFNLIFISTHDFSNHWFFLWSWNIIFHKLLVVTIYFMKFYETTNFCIYQRLFEFSRNFSSNILTLTNCCQITIR